jgi:hypothetical protein
VNHKEIKGTLAAALDEDKINTEHVVAIVYHQQAVFRVRAITQCTRYVHRNLFYSNTSRSMIWLLSMSLPQCTAAETLKKNNTQIRKEKFTHLIKKGDWASRF